MKLPFKELAMSRYIYINPETNTVHLLMPIMSGSEIGRDNTCKSVYSLQEFFGLAGANKQSSAIGVLTDYKAALEFDLKNMPVSEEKTRKTHRLSQINTYLEILNQIQHDTCITQPLMQQFPLYPEPLEHLMQENESNLHSIILRPRNQDNYLRTTAILPTFSANHDMMVNGQLISNDSILADTLWHNFQSISFTPKSKEGLIARVVVKRADLPVHFDEIRKVLIDEIKMYLGITVKFDVTQSTRYARSVPMNQSYIDEQLTIDADNPATTQDYAHALIEYCTPNLFDNVEGSPFYTVNDSEHLSLLTQFFLAELNIACKEQGITTANSPLINALKHYVAEFDSNEADWEALDKIWIEEVGRAQRNVTAHIAHEYCHPDHCFEDVNHNNELLNAAIPGNLKRQLKFFNVVTFNNDFWFSPGSYSADSGLGFSFGIFRGDGGVGVGGGAGSVGIRGARRDSAALTTIDKVRTNDREQSLLNLSQPLNLQASQSHVL